VGDARDKDETSGQQSRRCALFSASVWFDPSGPERGSQAGEGQRTGCNNTRAAIVRSIDDFGEVVEKNGPPTVLIELKSCCR
jgi:hypothetical protein